MKISSRFRFFLVVFVIIAFLLSGCGRDSASNNLDQKDEPTSTSNSEVLESGNNQEKDEVNKNEETSTGKNRDVTTTEAPDETATFNIRVTAEDVNIRSDKSTKSTIVSKTSFDSIYTVLGEALDSDGKTWYKIQYDFTSQGWIAGWLCEKTQGVPNRVYKSEPGKIIDPSINSDLYVSLLLMNEYTPKAFFAAYGEDYSKSDIGLVTRYTFQNGVFFETDDNGDFKCFGLGGEYDTTRPETIISKTCDILNNPGDEELIIFERNICYNLLILDNKTKKVLREYNLGYLWIPKFEVGDFLNNGENQIYLDSSDESVSMKGIYKVVDNDFVLVYDINSFDEYKECIKTDLKGNEFSMSVKIGDYNQNINSKLPDKVFSDTKDITDKKGLITSDRNWSVEKIGGEWFIKVRYLFNYPMIYYYWGPPGDDTEPNEIMYNDLGRVDILAKVQQGRPIVSDIKAQVKYDKPELLAIEPIGRDEGRLVDGPVLESSMEDAYKALGGDPDKFVYSESMELNGVSLFEFCSSIVDITVNSPNYQTTRGLKVGDSADKVESLYGKPDSGFSGDDMVSYKCGWKTGVNYYRGLDICYKDNVVVSFTLYQVILD